MRALSTTVVTLISWFVVATSVHAGERHRDRAKAEGKKHADHSENGSKSKRSTSRTEGRTEVERATVRVASAASLAPLEVDVPVWGATNRYHWTKIPERFSGYVFTQFDSQHKGLTEFEVRSAGRVLIAVTSRWGGGGNQSGEWMSELTTRKEFLAQGWRRVARMRDSGGDGAHDYHWLIFERTCEAGERLQIRTEKYCAPILLF